VPGNWKEKHWVGHKCSKWITQPAGQDNSTRRGIAKKTTYYYERKEERASLHLYLSAPGSAGRSIFYVQGKKGSRRQAPCGKLQGDPGTLRPGGDRRRRTDYWQWKTVGQKRQPNILYYKGDASLTGRKMKEMKRCFSRPGNSKGEKAFKTNPT